MSQIKIDLDVVEQLNGHLNRTIDKLSNLTNNVTSLGRNVDSEIASRRNIRSRLYNSSRDLYELEMKVRELQAFIANSVDRYNKAESDLAKQASLLSDNGINWSMMPDNMKSQVMSSIQQSEARNANPYPDISGIDWSMMPDNMKPQVMSSIQQSEVRNANPYPDISGIDWSMMPDNMKQQVMNSIQQHVHNNPLIYTDSSTVHENCGSEGRGQYQKSAVTVETAEKVVGLQTLYLDGGVLKSAIKVDTTAKALISVSANSSSNVTITADGKVKIDNPGGQSIEVSVANGIINGVKDGQTVYKQSITESAAIANVQIESKRSLNVHPRPDGFVNIYDMESTFKFDMAKTLGVEGTSVIQITLQSEVAVRKEYIDLIGGIEAIAIAPLLAPEIILGKLGLI